MNMGDNTARILICGVVVLLSFYLLDPNSTSPKAIEENQTEIVEYPETDEREAVINLDSDAYFVEKVIDGDTIRILRDGKSSTVRLIGIDTPETVDPRKPVQCFGKEASARTKELVDGKVVEIVFDETQDKQDKYGRLLAYVYLPDGTLINLALIQGGYAHEYTHRVPYKFQSEFQEAEQRARTRGVGLWADGACGERNFQADLVSVGDNINGGDTEKTVRRCDTNEYNCKDFSSQVEAQEVFIQCGGPATDIHHLDVDKDGVVCESLR